MISRRPIPHRHLTPRNLQAHPFACIIPAAVCLRSANQCHRCCRCAKLRNAVPLPFEGIGRDSVRSFCQYTPILRSRRNMQSAGKMLGGRRAAATRRDRCGRQGARVQARGGGWQPRGEGRHAIVDAECTIVDEVHVHARREAFLRSM